MLEREINLSSFSKEEARPENPQIQEQIVKIASSGAISGQLQLVEGAWVSKPTASPDLDLAFITEAGGQINYVGINAFGVEGCIGARLVKGPHVFQSGARTPLWDSSTNGLLHQGAKVALLTERDLVLWEKFYTAIDFQEMLSKIGPRVIESSGLKRTTLAERASYLQQLENILAKSDYLRKQGVVCLDRVSGDFDLAFIGANNLAVFLPLYHVRQGHLEGDFLSEAVSKEPLLCPGVVVPRPGESKRQAYRRAGRLTDLVRNGFPQPEKVGVAVVSSGQLSLWQKMGFEKNLKAQNPQAELSAEALIRFLYLGEDNLHPGELAKKGYSLPGGGQEYGLDAIVYTRHGPAGARFFAQVDNLLGMDLQKMKKDDWGLIPVGNIGGFIIVPDAWSPAEIKKRTRQQILDFNYRKGGQPAHILYVNNRLFKAWQERGSAFVKAEDSFPFGSLRREVSYGQGSQGETISLHLCRSEPEIGGVRYWLKEANGDRAVILMGDFGHSFRAGTRALSELINRERTPSGIRRSLGSGELPMVPGIYAPEYLLASARFPGLLRDLNEPVASFLRAEIFRRGDREKAAEFLGEEEAAKLWAMAPRDVRFWFGDGEIALKNIFLSHAHADHGGAIPYLDAEAALIARTETIAIAIGLTNSANSWRGKMEFVSDITQPYRPAYPRIYRQLHPIHYGQQRVSSGGITVEMHLVNHSIPGAAVVGFSSENQGWGVLYTGDLKMGARTEKAINDCAKRFNTLIVETTNDPLDPKSSAIFNESQVRDNLLKIIRERSTDLIVVMSPPNHLERLNSLHEVAEAANRHLAIGFKHAEIARQLRAIKEIAPLDVEGFDYWIPNLGQDVALWFKEMTKTSNYQKLLIAVSERGELGIVDQWRLSLEPEKWLVVVSPYNLLRTDFGGVERRHFITAIHSSYFPYDAAAKARAGENNYWLKNEGRGKLLADFEIKGKGGRVTECPRYGLHASGHATFKKMTEIIGNLLPPAGKDRQIILTHGEMPVRYEWELDKVLREKLGGVKIHSRMPHYNRLRPISQPGFKLDLG